MGLNIRVSVVDFSFNNLRVKNLSVGVHDHRIVLDVGVIARLQNNCRIGMRSARCNGDHNGSSVILGRICDDDPQMEKA